MEHDDVTKKIKIKKIKKINKIKKNKVTVEECGICCEPYNKSTHLSLVCEYVNCNYKTCVACIKTYLLNSTNDAHCMECKQPWTPKFLLALTKKWTTETYREHRQKLLCEVEISKLAESMAAAENYKASKNEVNVRATIRARMQEIRAESIGLQDSLMKSFHREYVLKNGNHVGDLPPEKKVFFMSCPSPTCNGMLSTQYKCGICEKFTCPTCHELIGLHKLDTATLTALHTCDPNNIASAEAIKKETRQCPGCHNRIYRTEGCSQMWCTGCHTAFDWNTGRKVISQQLHNPHWLEYQRTANNAQTQQPAGPLLCNGLCTRNDLRKIITKLQNYELYVKQNGDAENVLPLIADTIITIQYIHNFVTDVTNNYVRNIRDACQALNNHEKHRIQYIVGELNKEKLALYIFRNDRLRQKNTELLHIYELLSVVGIDIFNGLRDSILLKQPYYELVVAQVAEYNKLRLHCNGLFATISNTYNQTVSQINAHYNIRTKKFNTKTMTAAITDAI